MVTCLFGNQYSYLIRYRQCFFYFSFFLLSSIWVFGQKSQKQDSTFNEASKTFLVVPLITNSPVMDTGFGGLGMYFFKIDKEDEASPPSLAALYAIYTTNNSYVFVPFGKFFWNEDKNRASFGVGAVRINNDFTYDDQGNDLRLVYSELRNFLTAEYSRRIIGEFYLGVLYLGTKTNYKFDQGNEQENDFARDFFA